MEDPGGNTDGRGDHEFSWVMSGVRHPPADGQSASEYLDLGIRVGGQGNCFRKEVEESIVLNAVNTTK